MGFLIAIIDLHLFIKHITLRCIQVGQTMRENVSYHTKRVAEFSAFCNEVCLTTENIFASSRNKIFEYIYAFSRTKGEH